MLVSITRDPAQCSRIRRNLPRISKEYLPGNTLRTYRSPRYAKLQLSIILHIVTCRTPGLQRIYART